MKKETFTPLSSTFSGTYSGSSSSLLIRTYSDMYSKQFCDMKAAQFYAANATQGRCAYCGEKLYTYNNGKYEFHRGIHFDHIYPASRFGLFTEGNVALSCDTCNTSKGSQDPILYNDYRIKSGFPTLFGSEEFEAWLKETQKPYLENYPEIAKISMGVITDPKAIIEEHFSKVEITPGRDLPSYETSINSDIWLKVIEAAQDKYGDSLTVIDIKSRLAFANDFFVATFDNKKEMKDCTLRQLEAYGLSLVQSKSYSKGEVNKYRSLLKLLFEVLGSNAASLFNSIPTYGELMKLHED